MVHCLPASDPNRVWPFCPSPVPAVIFAILFGTLTIAHLVQSIMHRKAYCWVMIVAALWQTAAYGIREYSVFAQTNSGIYSVWFVMILIGPLWINAFVYMVLARMVWCYLPEKKLAGIKAWRLGMIFVLLDILTFFIQAAGASMASGDNLTNEQIMRGLHIYMIGVGVQQAFILTFTYMLFRFQTHYKREYPYPTTTLPMRLIYILYSVLALITVRIIYRLVEYSSGTSSAIPTHEAYMYVFESVPMVFAVLLLNIVHPGKVMPGRENNIPGRKERKRMIKEGLLPGKKGKYEHVEGKTGSDTELGLVEQYPTAVHTQRPSNYHGAPEFGMVEGYERNHHN